MALRQRLKKVISLKTVKVLDAFPKVDDACRQTSPIGGTASIIAYFLMMWLLVSETSYYLHSKIVYRFLPDTDFDAKLKVFVDVTVAMPCSSLGADILDSTNQNKNHFGKLVQRDTWFELEPAQRSHFEDMKVVNSHSRENYHQLHEFLWKSNYPSFVNQYIPRKTVPNRPPDACRIYGKLTLNKVAGNFHISVGRSFKLPQGHIHISDFIPENEYNFSHRINQFAFGEYSNGIINPLEGDEKITNERELMLRIDLDDIYMMLYQYFIEIVPTEVETYLSQQLTYQYSVKDHQRPINHFSGSHGVPGVYFKYDVSALKVKVLQERDSPIQFAVRLCATIGGVHVTSGLISSFIEYVLYYFNFKYLRKDLTAVKYENM